MSEGALLLLCSVVTRTINLFAVQAPRLPKITKFRDLPVFLKHFILHEKNLKHITFIFAIHTKVQFFVEVLKKTYNVILS